MSHNKDQIYQETCRQYVEWYGETHRKASTCMYWSLTGGLVFQRHGIRALLQAGTMMWPAFEDDGVNSTHFGYEWSPNDPGSQAALKLGLFPEIHIWLALPATQEIVDFSVKYLPEASANDIACPRLWTRTAPPEYLWATKDELPEGVIYRPEIPAMNWMLSRLKKDGYVKDNRQSLDVRVQLGQRNLSDASVR